MIFQLSFERSVDLMLKQSDNSLSIVDLACLSWSGSGWQVCILLFFIVKRFYQPVPASVSDLYPTPGDFNMSKNPICRLITEENPPFWILARENHWEGLPNSWLINRSVFHFFVVIASHNAQHKSRWCCQNGRATASQEMPR